MVLPQPADDLPVELPEVIHQFLNFPLRGSRDRIVDHIAASSPALIVVAGTADLRGAHYEGQRFHHHLMLAHPAHGSVAGRAQNHRTEQARRVPGRSEPPLCGLVNLGVLDALRCLP